MSPAVTLRLSSLSVAAAAWLLLAAPLAAAQNSVPVRPTDQSESSRDAETLPEAKELWEKALKKMGGQEAFEAIDSGRYTLQLKGPQRTGEMEVAFSDDKFLMKQKLPVGEAVIGYDGEIGWQSRPGDPPKPLTAQEIKEVRSTARLPVRLAELRDLYDMKTVEKAEFAKRQAWKVQLTPVDDADTSAYFAFFDVQNERWIGMISRTPRGRGMQIQQMRFEEFETVGDIEVATRIIMVETSPSLTQPVEGAMKLENIHFNDVDDAIFAPPPGFKGLHGGGRPKGPGGLPPL